ncbi:putative transporter [Dysgonomonas massiliensis]|uniref:putative transporter n=1 Tax=Dysgonomonas massiliensis TaxID=2040292 RepID=UPI000C77B2DA|nr:putative transporter [Dysgonomonas massiliensis]
MDWLIELLTKPSSIQTIILISIVSAIGLQLGKIKIFSISLGITFVFFVGILLGNFHLDINNDMLEYAQNFGLIIFVYALGLQVGPSFFSSLIKGGLKLNMLSMGLVAISLAMTVAFGYIFDISITDMVGIFSGATTNTPVLGAAQQALVQGFNPDSSVLGSMASATAATYPIGVVGVILVIAIMRIYWSPKDANGKVQPRKNSETYVAEFQILNPAIDGKQLKEVMKVSPRRFVISRIWREDKVSIPMSDSILHLNDHILVITTKEDLDHLKILFGEQENVDWNKEDIDWNHIDNSQLVSRQIIVSKSKINGVKLGSLRLRNTYGINITRINRAGFELFPSPNLTLQIGDKLTVVGEAASINNVARILGDELKRLQKPNLIVIFMGIALGLILGSIPIPIPGISVPIKLGITGGPIIMGILMGAYGPRFHVMTYATQSANQFMRQFGIVMYLACLGIMSGGHFVETVVSPSGLLWIGLGAALTIVPVAIIGIFAVKMFSISYEKSIGMLCGSMANPIALDYAVSTVEGDGPAAAYATVYPVSMFARIIFTQMLLLMLY